MDDLNVERHGDWYYIIIGDELYTQRAHVINATDNPMDTHERVMVRLCQQLTT